jgi:hypothetical protein
LRKKSRLRYTSLFVRIDYSIFHKYKMLPQFNRAGWCEYLMSKNPETEEDPEELKMRMLQNSVVVKSIKLRTTSKDSPPQETQIFPIPPPETTTAPSSPDKEQQQPKSEKPKSDTDAGVSERWPTRPKNIRDRVRTGRSNSGGMYPHYHRSSNSSGSSGGSSSRSTSPRIVDLMQLMDDGEEYEREDLKSLTLK